MGVIIVMRNIKRPITWLAIPVVIAFFLFTAPTMFWEEWESIQEVQLGTEAGEASIATRSLIFQTGVEMFKDKPVEGYGPGNFMFALERRIGLKMNAHR